MDRSLITTSIVLFVALLVLSGCIQPVSRTAGSSNEGTPTIGPTPAPTSTPTPTPPPTPTPTPEPTPTPTPEPTPTPSPTPDPEFFLTLQEPVFGSTVGTKTVAVVGFTLPGTTVEVNSELVRVDREGRFQGEVTLNPGPNVIDVRASGLHGGQLRDFRVVTYDPPPPPLPTLRVDRPGDLTVVGDQPILVEGTTTPQAMVTINGVAVPVNEEGKFSTMVQLVEGPNTIEVLAHFPNNRVLPRTISIIYSPP